jgi:Fe-S cluster assembly protein SufD
MAEPATHDARALFLDQHRAVSAALAGARLDWLGKLRAQGLARFAELGFPGRKVEAWKYTNLAPLEKLAFRPPSAKASGPRDDSVPSLVGGRHPVHRLVFVNGRFRDDLSAIGRLPEGAAIGGLAQAITAGGASLEESLGRAGEIDGMPLFALNTAFIDDGYVLRLPRETVLEEPVEIVFVGRAGDGPVAYHPRNLIVAGPGSSATVIEYHVGDGAYFANGATEILAGEHAIVRHCKIQDEAREAFHVSTTLARLARDAQLDSFAFAIGARLSRNEIRVTLDAPGAECRLNGAYMMKGSQHVDNTTYIDHVSPETSSRELYKGVLDDSARGVFQGTIMVRPDAQRINGRQTNRTLLLSDKAEIDTKPELEIYADDVKCAHGATVGELDEDALFYLRSRGIPELAARRLLIEAFLGEVIDGIALAGLQAPLEYMVADWMGPS